MLTSDKLLSLQKKVEIVARNAGKFAFENWATVEAVQKGTSGDVVTEVDKKLEEQIKAELNGLVETAAFLGEEFGGSKTTSYTWVVDPIDGTKNYAHRMPLFYVQICLIHEENPILAVIYDPVSDHLFAASFGNGAFFNGIKVRAGNEPDITNSTIEIDFGGNELVEWKSEVFKNLARVSYRTRVIAGQLSVYLVTGGIHAFVVVNPTTKIWDQAPRIILFKEAGFDVEKFEVDGHSVILASKGELFLKIKEIIMNTVA